MSQAPISLYFGVSKDAHADLEVVARTAIEWVALVRDLAGEIAPELQFEIELVRTEDGSLWLSNVLKSIQSGDRTALTAVAYGVLIFFASGPALHVQADLGDAFWARVANHVDYAELSDETKQEIAERIVAAIAKTDAEGRRRNLVREVEKDTSIQSIGMDFMPRPDGPACIIPRAAFPAYIDGPTKRPETPQRQTDSRCNVRVKIIRANLEEGATRPRWRFQEGDSRWSADIEDVEFVEAINNDRTGLHLAARQTMVVDVDIDTRNVDGAWEEVNRRITRVVEPRIARQGENFSLGCE